MPSIAVATPGWVTWCRPLASAECYKISLWHPERDAQAAHRRCAGCVRMDMSVVGGGGVGGGVQADEKGGTGERRGESCRLAIGVQRVHRRNRIRWQERRGDEGRGRVTDPSRSGGGSDGDGTGGGSRRAPGWRRRGCGRPARPQHFEISLTELQNPPKLARDSWNDLQLHCGGFSICFSSPTRMTLLKTLRRLLFRSSAHWVLQRSLGTVQNCC